MMTKASATAFATWLLHNQPGVFATIHNHHVRTQKAQARAVSGLGDDLQPVDVTAQYIGTPTIDTSTFYTPSAADLNVNPNVTLNIDTSTADATTPGIFSNLGSSIGSAVSNVASFLLKGTAVLAPVAVAALAAQSATQNRNAQLAVLNTQAGRAQAGMAPAGISYTANGTPVYIPGPALPGQLTSLPAGLGAPITLPNGQVGYTVTPQALQNLAPSFLQKYGIWLIGGGAALAAILLFS